MIGLGIIVFILIFNVISLDIKMDILEDEIEELERTVYIVGRE